MREGGEPDGTFGQVFLNPPPPQVILRQQRVLGRWADRYVDSLNETRNLHFHLKQLGRKRLRLLILGQCQNAV